MTTHTDTRRTNKHRAQTFSCDSSHFVMFGFVLSVGVGFQFISYNNNISSYKFHFEVFLCLAAVFYWKRFSNSWVRIFMAIQCRRHHWVAASEFCVKLFTFIGIYFSDCDFANGKAPSFLWKQIKSTMTRFADDSALLLLPTPSFFYSPTPMVCFSVLYRSIGTSRIVSNAKLRWNECTRFKYWW